jgi:hypothetical protein
MVYSDDLNDMQDALIDLYEEHDIIDMKASPWWYDSGPHPTWGLDATNPEKGWKCLGGIPTAPLFLEVSARESFVLVAINLKYYNAHGSSDLKPQGVLYLVNPELATDATAPSLGASVADFTGVTTIPHGTWGVRSVSGLSISVSAGRRLLFVISDATTDDYVAAVNLVVKPLVLSP